MAQHKKEIIDASNETVVTCKSWQIKDFHFIQSCIDLNVLVCILNRTSGSLCAGLL